LIDGARANLALEIRQVLDQERERRRAKPKKRCWAEPVEPLQDVHPAVAATARALRKAKPDDYDVVRAIGPSHRGIKVGSASVERVITFLDVLARALDSRGQKLEPIGTYMRVTVASDTVTFTLNERIEKRNLPTPEELAKEERLRKKRERGSRLGIWSFHQERAYPEFDFIRTGWALRSRRNMLEAYAVIGKTAGVKDSKTWLMTLWAGSSHTWLG